MTEGQLASRTNDLLVAGGKGPMTDADFGTIISVIDPLYMSTCSPPLRCPLSEFRAARGLTKAMRPH